MPFIPVPDTAQVRIEGAVDGQMTINDLYFHNPGGIGLSDIQSLTTNILNWFEFSFAAMLSDEWATTAVHSRDLTTATSFAVDQANPPVPGGVAGEPAPNNVAACVSFRTGLSGRSFRGRNYVPAVPNSLIDTNTLDPTFVADVINTYALLLAGGGALPGAWEWVVVSRFSGVGLSGNPLPRVTGLATPVTGVIFTNSIVDSQRRRLPGRGK